MRALLCFFFFSSRRRHTRFDCDWSSDVCSSDVKSGQAIGKLVEYCGDAVESLSVDERATMTNMTAEVGGFTGYVAPDEKTVEYLMAYRGMSRAQAERLCASGASDPDAEYCEVIEIDAAAIRPLIR